MKLIIYFSAIFSVILFSYKESEVSAQGLQQFYGGGPIAYSDSRDDDDIGLLLTVLLLATRNKGNGGCCGCCNCGGNNIPIPYPIPIPTNNPVITMSRHNDDEGSSGGAAKPEEINIVSENISSVEAESKSSAKTKNTNDNAASASSDASSDASSNDNPASPEESET